MSLLRSARQARGGWAVLVLSAAAVLASLAGGGALVSAAVSAVAHPGASHSARATGSPGTSHSAGTSLSPRASGSPAPSHSATPGPAPTAAAVPAQLTLPAVVSPGTFRQINSLASAYRAVVVVIRRPSALGSAPWPQWQHELANTGRGALTTVIVRPVHTGPGGALLVALAAARVFVSGVTADRLPAVLAPLTADKSICDAVCVALARMSLPGGKIGGLDPGRAVVIPRPPHSKPVKPPVVSGGGPSGLTWAVLMIIVLAAAAAGLRFRAVRRRQHAGMPNVPPQLPPGDSRLPRHGNASHSGPPAVSAPAVPYQRPPGYARPSNPRVQDRGILRTELGPQGYVEIDGWLRRVTWAGQGPTPRPGQEVTIRAGGPTGLIVTDEQQQPHSQRH